jgi:elongation factor 3
MIVSHDTLFLDKVITDVIHYESRKLVYYHGNLTHFVKIHPEARYYYELSQSTLKFKFPTPERLEGINSTTRAVLKLDNSTYTYPGASKPTLVDINVKLCLGSRVAVLGAYFTLVCLERFYIYIYIYGFMVSSCYHHDH